MRQVLLFSCGLLALRSEESVGALISAIGNEVNKGDLTELLPVALECIKECKREAVIFTYSWHVPLVHV